LHFFSSKKPVITLQQKVVSPCPHLAICIFPVIKTVEQASSQAITQTNRPQQKGMAHSPENLTSAIAFERAVKRISRRT
jgi:hypothetical protein